MAVLYYTYLQYYTILYDLLDIISFLSIKVNYSPCLVYLHQMSPVKQFVS